MGQLYIPTEKEIKGPWFIGNNELEELHEIFEYIDQKMIESVDLEIQNKATNDLNNGLYKDLESATKVNKKYYSKKIKRVSLISNDEMRLIDNSINGILRDPKLKNFSPKTFHLDIEYGYENQFSLTIKRRFDGEINYKLKTFDQECGEEIKYKIESWLEKNQPNRAKQIWSKFAFLFFMISFFVATITSQFMISIELPDFKTIYKSEVNEIIKSGVNNSNEQKSIELLLKYVTDYKPDNIKEVKIVSKPAIQIFSISIFILIISIFRPKTTIGIGSHSSLMRFYKFYTTFVLITLPLTFIVPPLIEWINNLIGF